MTGVYGQITIYRKHYTSTTFTTLEVTSEPYLVLTFRGYIGAVEVIELATGNHYEFFHWRHKVARRVSRAVSHFQQWGV